MFEDRERPDKENHDIDKMNQKLMKQLRPADEKVGKPENERTNKLNETTKTLMEKRRKLWSEGKYKRVEYAELNKTIKKMITEDLRKHQQEVEKILKRNRGLNCLILQQGKLIISFKRQKEI
ncbi:hypothetical protein HHI36_009331 [Cryptolaemus montrouzieri]|uniref:Uncharacterized protein n=1 Tax=Cryptolaemus montrouzieri TaxID=559131 RepID=A0ABD2MV42_9CUCU